MHTPADTHTYSYTCTQIHTPADTHIHTHTHTYTHNTHTYTHIHTHTHTSTQLGWPDMKLPIMYTMSWPERVPVQDATWPRLDLAKASQLTFRAPDR